MKITIVDPSYIPYYGTGSLFMWAVLNPTETLNQYVIKEARTCREEYIRFLLRESAKCLTKTSYRFMQKTIVTCITVNHKQAYIDEKSSLAIKYINSIEAKYGWSFSKIVKVQNKTAKVGTFNTSIVFAFKPSTHWLKTTHTLSAFLLILRSAFLKDITNVETYDDLMAAYKSRPNDPYLNALGTKHHELFTNWASLFNGLSKVAFSNNVEPINVHRDGIHAILTNTCHVPVIPRSKITQYLKV